MRNPPPNPITTASLMTGANPPFPTPDGANLSIARNPRGATEAIAVPAT
jgi:hypothetical protein